MSDNELITSSEETLGVKTAKGEQKPKLKADKHIWGIYISLVLISIVELFSASSREVSTLGVYEPILRHGFMLAMGLCIILFLQRIHYRMFLPFIPVFAVISAGLMIYVMFFGEIVNGARRSVDLFIMSVQPADMLKLAAPLMIAYFISKNQMPKGVKTKGVFWCALVVIVFGGLLFNQGLTNTILLMAISLSMMLIGGVQWKKFLVVLICYGAIAAGALYYKLSAADDRVEKAEAEKKEMVADSKLEQIMRAREANRDSSERKSVDRSGVWYDRLAQFFNDSIPKYQQPITSENQQEMYSYMAQANGGPYGVGPGNSREAARLPLAFSDYIYSIIIEDMGFIGGLFVLMLYIWLLGRAGAIASRCSRAFPALLVTGMAVMIVFQALFHMGIVTGVFPVSGQPLPLISKGGTSILITSIAFGIMLSVSRHAVRGGKKNEIKQEMNELPESVRAENPLQLK